MASDLRLERLILIVVSALLLFRAEGITVGITYVENAVAKGGGESRLSISADGLSPRGLPRLSSFSCAKFMMFGLRSLLGR